MEMTIEQKKPQTTLSERYKALLELEPKLITNFVPQDAKEQKTAFLAGEVRNPDHTYDKLDAIDFDERIAQISAVGHDILASSELNPKFAGAYEQFIDGYEARTRLMQLAWEYNAATDEADKDRLRTEYMRLNIEMYGMPDETTYRSLLQEKLAAISQKNLTGEAATLRDELFALTGFSEGGELPERFRPSQETIEWVQGIVEGLYGGMLAHVPEGKETFSVIETQAIFQEIIRDEFGEAAEDWKVDVESAKSINVKSTEKRIVIPDDRGELSYAQLRGLVVHELGVHMLRAVMGEETDLEPLANGLSDYYDAEEGLGVVMEQALKGKFSEAGIDHYITAGLAYHDNKDFRDTFEIKWRLAALGSLKDDDLTDAACDKAQSSAYGGTMRMFRGTDELPWFKDLAYYNGAVNTWHYLEEIRGDDLRFTFVLLGKNDPSSKAHERIVYETSSK